MLMSVSGEKIHFVVLLKSRVGKDDGVIVDGLAVGRLAVFMTVYGTGAMAGDRVGAFAEGAFVDTGSTGAGGGGIETHPLPTMG